MDYRQWTIDRH